MPTQTFRMGRQAEFDIVSYGRRGLGRPDRLSPAQVAQIARTVRRTPEVLVKVSGGGDSVKAVAAHFSYISRRGELEVETDDGERLLDKGAVSKLIGDWDIDLDALIDHKEFTERGGRTAHPKLVHNIVLSMPAGTSPQRLLEASRGFAREEFALQHRYALVLHTDQNHPHVHLVVGAHRREGGRLNIRKADLRRWRERFADQLRSHGVAANATPAQIRGRTTDHLKDGLYRAAQRGAARVVRNSQRAPEQAAETARAVQHDWQRTASILEAQGQGNLAAEVQRFMRSLENANSRRPFRIHNDRHFQIHRVPQQLELSR